MSTPAQLVANQANAQLSTGPATPQGKAKSSLNALKHGLFSQGDCVLPGESQADFEELIEQFHEEFIPRAPQELVLVHHLASLTWRQLRLHRFETKRFLQWEKEANDQETALVADGKLFQDLTRISLYGARLARERKETLAELERVGAARREEERIIRKGGHGGCMRDENGERLYYGYENEAEYLEAQRQEHEEEEARVADAARFTPPEPSRARRNQRAQEQQRHREWKIAANEARVRNESLETKEESEEK